MEKTGGFTYVTLFEMADSFFDEITQFLCVDLEIEIGCTQYIQITC